VDVQFVRELEQTDFLKTLRGELAAVKDLVAQVFQYQREIVRPDGRLRRDARVPDLAHEDGVIAPLDRIDQGALDESGKFFKNRRAQAAAAKRLAADRVAFAFEGSKNVNATSF
jgi:hypothetical protein